MSVSAGSTVTSAWALRRLAICRGPSSTSAATSSKFRSLLPLPIINPSTARLPASSSSIHSALLSSTRASSPPTNTATALDKHVQRLRNARGPAVPPKTSTLSSRRPSKSPPVVTSTPSVSNPSAAARAEKSVQEHVNRIRLRAAKAVPSPPVPPRRQTRASARAIPKVPERVASLANKLAAVTLVPKLKSCLKTSTTFVTRDSSRHVHFEIAVLCDDDMEDVYVNVHRLWPFVADEAPTTRLAVDEVNLLQPTMYLRMERHLRDRQWDSELLPPGVHVPDRRPGRENSELRWPPPEIIPAWTGSTEEDVRRNQFRCESDLSVHAWCCRKYLSKQYPRPASCWHVLYDFYDE